jgi:hypothetical protein
MEDWENTSDEIWRGYGPVIYEDSNIFLASNWATPALKINNHFFQCWMYFDECPWPPDEMWPQIAIDHLNHYCMEPVDVDYVSITER